MTVSTTLSLNDKRSQGLQRKGVDLGHSEEIRNYILGLIDRDIEQEENVGEISNEAK